MKSLTQLRGIAQSFGIKDIFKKTDKQLEQEILLKQTELYPAPKETIPRPEYDARLMTKPPSKKSSEAELIALLKPFTDRGMHLTVDAENWSMRWGKKEDTGTMRMPLTAVYRCAEDMFK